MSDPRRHRSIAQVLVASGEVELDGRRVVVPDGEDVFRLIALAVSITATLADAILHSEADVAAWIAVSAMTITVPLYVATCRKIARWRAAVRLVDAAIRSSGCLVAVPADVGADA